MDPWDRRFRAEVAGAAASATSILDVGAGAHPTIPVADRQPSLTYVGLDVSAEELDRASPDSYDDTVVAKAEELVPELVDRFDLAVSFMAMEHIDDLATALQNLREYLRPGGKLIAQLAGGRSPFALANRVLGERLKNRILEATQGRRAEEVFPARYDRCTRKGLLSMLEGAWGSVEVTPLYNGIGYVAFSRLLRSAYVLYEDIAYRRDWGEVAQSYLVVATRHD